MFWLKHARNFPFRATLVQTSYIVVPVQRAGGMIPNGGRIGCTESLHVLVFLLSVKGTGWSGVVVAELPHLASCRLLGVF